MKRAIALSLCAAGFVAACGSSGPVFTSDDVAIFDGPFFDQTLPNDANDQDVVDAAKFNGGGPFTCGGCVCDGTMNMCVLNNGGGGAPILDASDEDVTADADVIADASADANDASDMCTSDDASINGCIEIPLSCLPKPDCNCLQQAFPSCPCTVDPSGDGFILTCIPKP